MPEDPTAPPDPFAVVRQPAAPMQHDEMGFVTSSQPNLSAGQVKFILARAVSRDHRDAAKLAGVDIDEVLAWFDDSDFNATYQEFVLNKREGVKQIGQQITPLLLLKLTQILETGHNKEVIAAAKLIANMQGMLITANAPVDRGVLEEIRQELMRPRPVRYRDVTQDQ
jgi:hypothetical protein